MIARHALRRVTDFESSGGPDDARVFNGGCRESLTTAQHCTQGWQYVAAGAEAPAGHAYYMELRDRSGFDLDGNGQNDRDPIGFEAGLSLVYTDETHGYGNVGTDDPPAQSPLDSQPEPGSATPDLNDAAWTSAEGDSSYSDSGTGHTDNYSDPGNPEPGHPWVFRFDCLGFDVTSMSGAADGPEQSDGDLTGDVGFTMGAGCGSFDYGYDDPAPVDRTDPEARMRLIPRQPWTSDRVVLTAEGSSDDTSAGGDLGFAWNFGDGGKAVDATGPVVRTRFREPGPRLLRLTVTDEAGNASTVGRALYVPRYLPCSSARVDRDGWRLRRDSDAHRGVYCAVRSARGGREVLTLRFRGPTLKIVYGESRSGGHASVWIDGQRRAGLGFGGPTRAVDLDHRRNYRGLVAGPHRVRIVLHRGAGFVEGFVIRR